MIAARGCITLLTIPFIPLSYVIVGWLLWNASAPTWVWVIFWTYVPVLALFRIMSVVLEVMDDL